MGPQLELMERTMQLNPHLAFDGQCEAAFRFYEQCLGGKIGFLMTYGDSPLAEQVASDWGNKIVHATLALGDQRLTGADEPAEWYRKPQGFSVLLSVEAAPEAERIFEALAKNGTVRMPLQETFWALRFGMLVDQFGVPWMVNCERAPT
jgi:PhnB protein